MNTDNSQSESPPPQQLTPPPFIPIRESVPDRLKVYNPPSGIIEE